MKQVFAFIAVLALSACAQFEWVPGEVNGLTLEQAQSQCRAQARELVREIRPFGDRYDAGPADFPPDSPRDLENREMARCLNNLGFRQVLAE